MTGGDEFGGVAAFGQGGVTRGEEVRGEDPVVPLRGDLTGDVRVGGDDGIDPESA